MSMEISGNYKDYKNHPLQNEIYENDSLKELQEGQDKAKDTAKEQGIPVPKDEYISSEEAGDRPSGLYRMGQDENGNPKVLYDDPKKRGSADGSGQPEVKQDNPNGNEQPKIKSGSPKDNEEKCTGSTDKVDREIEKLKEQKKQLEQQIRAASGDEKKEAELKKKLARVESELSRKDNDTYRRQNTVFS